MFDKLFEAKQKAEEVKKRLDDVTVTGQAASGKIAVSANGNRKILSIKINEAFLKEAETEELEDLLLTAVNRALEQAENINQTEMAAITKDMLGNMGALFGK